MTKVIDESNLHLIGVNTKVITLCVYFLAGTVQ